MTLEDFITRMRKKMKDSNGKMEDLHCINYDEMKRFEFLGMMEIMDKISTILDDRLEKQ